MKLIFCPECGDIVRLIEVRRNYDCGESYGNYVDSLNAVIGGKAIPLGISNPSLLHALETQPPVGLGSRFEAFVIPVKCDTITKI